MSASVFVQKILHVFEKLYMTSLVGSNGDAMNIFFNRCLDDFVYTAVMSKMNNFHALALHDAPHDIDSSIMTVEQGRSCYNPDPVICRWNHGGKELDYV